MLLLKIANKLFFSHNIVIDNYIKHLLHSAEILEFVKKKNILLLRTLVTFIYLYESI